MLEDVSDNHEVGGDGDTENGKGGQDGGNAYPEEEIKQTQLQEIIKDVGPGEACAVLGGGVGTEGEVGREVVVGKETNHIANGEGDVKIDKVLQNPVDGVVDGYGQYTDYSEAEQLANGLFLCQIFDFHGAKVVKTERNAK